MAEKKYLDYTGLQDVAGKVNTRLKTVTSMPVTASADAVRLYVGTTTVNYKKGHVYQWQSTQWVDITDTFDINTLAPAFSTSASYVVGDLVTYEENLYICTTDHSGAWNASNFSVTTVASQIDALDTKIDSIPKAVVPKGTVAFASLPALSIVDVGWMYNISDNFTTTSDFVIPGISESAGSNVYCIEVDVSGTMTKKWDVFAAGGNVVVDQTYDATSTNPQSGTAVAQAIEQSITSVLNTSF